MTDSMRILRMFLHENVRMSFGLNRFVTMNALGDLHLGPRDHVIKDHDDVLDDRRHVDVTTRLKDLIIDENDAPDETLAQEAYDDKI